MRWKMKRKGFMLIPFAIFCAVILILVVGTGGYGISTINQIKSEKIRLETENIDKALEQYGANHTLLGDITYEKEHAEIKYNNKRSYPIDLEALKEVKDQGILNTSIDFDSQTYMQDGNIEKTWDYQPLKNSKGEITGYKLTANLPNGNSFISKNSHEAK